MPMKGHKTVLQAVCGLFSRQIQSRPKSSKNALMKSSMLTVFCRLPAICTVEGIMHWTKKRGACRYHLSLVVEHILQISRLRQQPTR